MTQITTESIPEVKINAPATWSLIFSGVAALPFSDVPARTEFVQVIYPESLRKANGWINRGSIVRVVNARSITPGQSINGVYHVFVVPSAWPQ